MLAMRSNNNGHPVTHKYDDHPASSNGVFANYSPVRQSQSPQSRFLSLSPLQGSLVGSGLAPSSTLEEYVDILSVQQLLLDTPTSSSIGQSQGVGVQRPRPRLNVQKSVEQAANVNPGESEGTEMYGMAERVLLQE